MENRKAAIEWFSMLKEKFVKTKYEGYLDLAISALEKQEAEMWIPCKERLPEIHKDVLVTDREVSDAYVSYYCGGGYWNTDTGGANNRIIAWKPLHDPYQEDEA